MLVSKSSIFLTLFILFGVFQAPALAIQKPYIVYLGGHSHGDEITLEDLRRVEDSHHELLGSFLGSKEKAKDAIFYSYKRYINGFAAMLEEEEAAEVAKHPDVVSVFLNRGRELHTTHTWDFLMLERNGKIHPSSLWKQARFGEDTIIANLDTGIWPESESFKDDGYGPIPSRWKGICQSGDPPIVTCNKKLIGARYFNKGYIANVGSHNTHSINTPRDMEGHGSHTLSTAGGDFVPGVNVFGVGNGTAKGGSPRARVAAYRVCYPKVDGGSCFDADIMAGIEMAIHDGVDVVSLSLGGLAIDYFEDALAIAAFHAVKEGIVVVASAGNSGPDPGTVSNVAPWLITVGASTLDRKFESNIKLPNGHQFQGESISLPLPKEQFYPLITAEQAKADNAPEVLAALCKEDALDPKKVKGKIVVCLRGETDRVDKGEQAKIAGAVGMILRNNEDTGNEIEADPHFLPASHITYTDGLALVAYINSTKDPKGYITPSEARLGTKPAPFMAAFSSRGPNMITPEILKPDITAPGVNIIAAFSEATGPTSETYDHRRIPYTVDSGTSMSCPHVSGVVGLLKTLHPEWSPAAIRSAIMTTARTRDNTGNHMLDATREKATPFAYGSGHVRPNRAMDPGLVYDLKVNDYLDFLCASGYNQTLLQPFAAKSYKCPKNANLNDFNYPSISVTNLSRAVSVTVTRTLKNVGKPGTYRARVQSPAGILISVKPNLLIYKKIGEEKSFKVTIKTKTTKFPDTFFFGELIWSDGHHYVRSPIAVSLN